MNYEAIMKVHTNVVTIDTDESGNTTAWDSNGNVVTLDTTAINSKTTESENEVKLHNLRERRDELLFETDHWGLSDMPAMTQAQTDYRQALRDITDNYTSLETVVWPTKP